MFLCNCLKWYRKRIFSDGHSPAALCPAHKGHQVHTSGLPAPLPSWPEGTGFATGKLVLGEIELAQVSTFEEVWRTPAETNGATFSKPVNLPTGFNCLGYYAQPTNVPLQGWVLVIKGSVSGEKPPLSEPTDYALVWSSEGVERQETDLGFFWLPLAPKGYRSVGYVVTNRGEKPSKGEVVCVRSDLTEECVIDGLIWDTDDFVKMPPFVVWTTKPLLIGMYKRGICTGTFYCHSSLIPEFTLAVSCLKNLRFHLDLMPTLEQVRKIIATYGPKVYFHPNEQYLPTSVPWFFEQGSLLYSAGQTDAPVRITADGSNLPAGGCDDKRFWLDLPKNDHAQVVKKGNLSSAVTYVHVKPMYGGTFSDIAFWLFYGFNGASTAKVGKIKSISLGKIGEHVSDWEHFTLRVDNFTGELRQMYFSQHSCGVWMKPHEVEFISDNRPVVYAAKNSHASYAHEGDNLQGDENLGIGIRNDTRRSNFILDSTVSYELISVEYLEGKGETDYPLEPCWLQYMREWGPKVEYDSRAELEKVLKYLPAIIRKTVIDLLNKLPDELGGEEGPTGPKSKDNWCSDEA